ncbi:hypothetical protein HYC85_027696 [Camellia sinensis]|uniref:Uncharacterized protein n=1 Tax=Camellia sinensis TaxID=4442 RepID=A0A7J7FT42_CAMSI|nr:hypothetical protein HYC85_027696 [Camellia sinensis]
MLGARFLRSSVTSPARANDENLGIPVLRKWFSKPLNGVAVFGPQEKKELSKTVGGFPPKTVFIAQKARPGSNGHDWSQMRHGWALMAASRDGVDTPFLTALKAQAFCPVYSMMKVVLYMVQVWNREPGDHIEARPCLIKSQLWLSMAGRALVARNTVLGESPPVFTIIASERSDIPQVVWTRFGNLCKNQDLISGIFPFDINEIDPALVKIAKLEKALKKSQGFNSIPNIEDGYIEASVSLLEKFKMPHIDRFDGSGDLIVHVRFLSILVHFRTHCHPNMTLPSIASSTNSMAIPWTCATVYVMRSRISLTTKSSPHLPNQM